MRVLLFLLSLFFFCFPKSNAFSDVLRLHFSPRAGWVGQFQSCSRSMWMKAMSKHQTEGESEKDSLFQISRLIRSYNSRLQREERQMINDELLRLLLTRSFLLNDLTNLMELLKELSGKGFLVFKDDGLAALIKVLLNLTHSNKNTSFGGERVMEVLSGCVEVGTQYQNLQPAEKSMLKDLVGSMNTESIVKDFLSYSEYFYVLGKLCIPWKEVSKEKRRKLMSSMPRFGEVANDEVGKSARKLIFGVDELLILKQNAEDLDEEVREYYERLLMRVLEGESGSKKKKREGEDKSIPVRHHLKVYLGKVI